MKGDKKKTVQGNNDTVEPAWILTPPQIHEKKQRRKHLKTDQNKNYKQDSKKKQAKKQSIAVR